MLAPSKANGGDGRSVMEMIRRHSVLTLSPVLDLFNDRCHGRTDEYPESWHTPPPPPPTPEPFL